MYETYTTVQGRLVADPAVKEGRFGSFTTFRVAQSERRPDRGEPGRWVESEPSFYDVSVSKASGENAARCLRKGQPVLVYGKLKVRQFRRDDGSYGASTELEAYALGHDLRWGVTAFTRNADLEPGTGGDVRAGEGPGLGDPERDPYVMADGPGAEVTAAEAGALGAEAHDTGPLVAPDAA
ncbi:single-stranded DNA-binding protein [Phycicoccus sp. CSK15P-2]|uniref:single-stranded DNA-binding protein n=1 Tax=Phycicoccus sp. CSK15P-2 TaxID=2807627 RepID=UPI0019526FB7|nr:single-stranded DNA-binding protein [Phycicoccus sp. CSK15P-2]MBM6404279.1 single-stranded DNA-binding protein [Phycicoccus sp. CSK15P-2]